MRSLGEIEVFFGFLADFPLQSEVPQITKAEILYAMVKRNIEPKAHVKHLL